MIVVTVDMWPLGDKSRAYRLGRTFIWNRGNGTLKRGNYGVAVRRKGREELALFERANTASNTARTGEVLNYPRASYNVWRLVIRALLSAFPEERRKAQDD